MAFDIGYQTQRYVGDALVPLDGFASDRLLIEEEQTPDSASSLSDKEFLTLSPS